MKITMYELLGMVKDGKAPKRIIYNEYVYELNEDIKNYEREIDPLTTINWDYIAMKGLNEIVEILEEDMPTQNQRIERLNLFGEMNLPCVFFKVNEIINYLNSKGDE